MESPILTPILAVHVVMRISGKLHDVRNVAELHERVAQREGIVWVGKFGACLGSRTIQRLNDQTAQEVDTYLYLVESGRRGIEVARCRVRRVSADLPVGEEERVPSYYAEKQLWGIIGVWFEADSVGGVDPSELDRLVVMSSGRPVRWSLRRSMSGFFLVRQVDDPG